MTSLESDLENTFTDFLQQVPSMNRPDFEEPALEDWSNKCREFDKALAKFKVEMEKRTLDKAIAAIEEELAKVVSEHHRSETLKDVKHCPAIGKKLYTLRKTLREDISIVKAKLAESKLDAEEDESVFDGYFAHGFCPRLV